jgi:hypothetical protein
LEQNIPTTPPANRRDKSDPRRYARYTFEKHSRNILVDSSPVEHPKCGVADDALVLAADDLREI